MFPRRDEMYMVRPGGSAQQEEVCRIGEIWLWLLLFRQAIVPHAIDGFGASSALKRA